MMKLAVCAVLLLLAGAARADRGDERLEKPRQAAPARPQPRPQQRPPVPPNPSERPKRTLDRAGAGRAVWPEPRPVPAPKPVRDPRHALRDERGAPKTPASDERGKPLQRRPLARAPDHAAIEAQRDHYYWHRERGVRWCHYYDRWGAHWYGFFAGPRFYWTRWYVGRWWWRDEARGRWAYWYEGYWWWQDPRAPGSLYVYVDGQYLPYGPLVSYAGGPALTVSLIPSPPPDTYTSNAPVQSYYSADSARLAQIVDDDREARLYDSAVAGTPAYLAFLSTGAASVRFVADPAPGLVVTRLDGSEASFDFDGRPIAAPQVVAPAR